MNTPTTSPSVADVEQRSSRTTSGIKAIYSQLKKAGEQVAADIARAREKMDLDGLAAALRTRRDSREIEAELGNEADAVAEVKEAEEESPAAYTALSSALLHRSTEAGTLAQHQRQRVGEVIAKAINDGASPRYLLDADGASYVGIVRAIQAMEKAEGQRDRLLIAGNRCQSIAGGQRRASEDNFATYHALLLAPLQ